MRSANTWAKRSTNASNGCAECLGMPLAITDIDRWRNWGSPTDALGLGVVAQRSTGDRGTLAGCDSVLGTVKLFRQRSAWEYAAGLCRGRPCQTSEPAPTKGRSGASKRSSVQRRLAAGGVVTSRMSCCTVAYVLEWMLAAVLADSSPLREAHPELRVAMVKMEDALQDLYEAADAVLIEQLGTHPHSVARLCTGWARRRGRSRVRHFPGCPNA